MKHSSLKLNAILNGIKQCFGILFPLITFPYVSRMLGEEGFGRYSFSWSIVSYFVLLAGLGINTYAVREGARVRDDKVKLTQFCSEAFTINFTTTILSICVLFVVSFASSKIKGYIPLIAIQSTALLLNLIGRDWINGIYEDYFYITIRYLIIQVISLLLMFLLIRSPEDVWKYCVVAVFASFGGNIPNILYIRKYVRTRIVLKPNYSKHLKPLLVLFVTQIAITVYVNADITMLGFFSDDATVGIYSLSSKIYNLIKTVVNAMVVVTLPRMTYMLEKNPKGYEGSLRKISSYLMLVAFPVAAGLMMLSNEVILIAGGAGYQSGQDALRILSLAMVFAVLCTFCMNSILIANRKEKECLKATLVSAVINIALNFFALPLWGMTGAAITTIIAEASNMIMLLIASKKVVSLRFFDRKNLIQSMIATSLVCGSCIIIKRMDFGIIVTFVLSVILSCVTYGVALLVLQNVYIKENVTSILNMVFRKGVSK